MKQKLNTKFAFGQVQVSFKERQIINHIITDPPYAISKKNSLHTMKKAVNGINFGDWDWGFSLLIVLTYQLLIDLINHILTILFSKITKQILDQDFGDCHYQGDFFALIIYR